MAFSFLKEVSPFPSIRYNPGTERGDLAVITRKFHKNLDRFERAVLGAGLVLVLLVGVGVDRWLCRSVPFGVPVGRMPYKLEPYRAFTMPSRAYNGRAGQAFSLVNYKGEGYPSLVKSGNPGLTIYEERNGRLGDTRWQKNLDPDFVWAKHNARLGPATDINGDGRQEIIYSCCTEDGFRNEVGAIDPLADRYLGKVALPGGPDRRPDGVWDGYYVPFGSFEHERADGTRTRALVVAADVFYDALGRGVFALDLERGEIIWRFDLAGSPKQGNQHVADLDGDGRSEIIISTNAPDNLGDQRVNGMSDSQVTVLVLNDEGGLLWARVLAQRSCYGLVRVGDVDGDGLPEVLSGVSSISRPYSEVTIWDGPTGALRHRVVLENNLNGMGLLNDETGQTRQVLISALHSGLAHLNIQDGKMRLVNWQVRGHKARVLLCGDILEEPGQEAVVIVVGVGLFILDARGQPLAALEDESLKGGGQMVFWRPNEERKLLLGSRLTPQGVDIRSRSRWYRTDLRPATASLGGLLLLSGGLVLRRKQRGFYHQHLDMNDPDILREMRLRLLSDLELSGHGAMGILKSLRRLIWTLETRSSGVGASLEVNRRLENHWQDFRGGVLPHVRDILGLAERVGIVPHVVVTVRENLEELEGILIRLAAGGFESEAILEDIAVLQRCSDDTESGMQTIRRNVEDLFRADWSELWNRVLRAHAEDLQAARVRVEQNGLLEGVFCRLDPRQLEFMLDNLVGNAVRAMAESADPRLRICTRVEDGMVIGEVRDTGWGIAPEDWDRIMETPYSSREGGGLGLFETQRILRLFGGGISVRESRAGEGTTLRLVVPESRAR